MSEALAQQLALLPDYLSRHLLLTVTALAIGVGVSLPLAILLTRVWALKGPVLMVASAIQTIPSLALLALMVPLLGRIGFMPAAIALILYSMLPVIRNTVTGIEEVDPDIVEAGRALGMTNGQLLTRVQLPLAMPVIIAGIRTATVWVVGIATLSTPVGATSLGNYIFSGLQTQNFTAVLVGCVSAAGLALVLDGLIRLLELGAITRRPWLSRAAALVTVAVITIGLSPLWSQDRDTAAARFVIGTKTFTEQYILAELIAAELGDIDVPATTLDSLGSTVVFDALVAGRIDAYVDYTGTIWANHMQRSDNPGREAVLAGVREWLAANHGITQVVPLGFENAYVIAMPAARAGELRVRSIDELVPFAPELSLGGDYEFFDRPEWRSLRSAYGIEFASRVSMDATLMYQAVAEGEVDAIAAFSTDGRIDAYDLAVLSDPREALPPYDAVLLLRAGIDPAIANRLAELEGRIGNEQMRAANRAVDLDGATVAAAAMRLKDRL